MSYSESEDNNHTNITDEEESIIYGVLPYISLVFELTSILIITMMASLVCVTIKKTRSLH